MKGEILVLLFTTLFCSETFADKRYGHKECVDTEKYRVTSCQLLDESRDKRKSEFRIDIENEVLHELRRKPGSKKTGRFPISYRYSFSLGSGPQFSSTEEMVRFEKLIQDLSIHFDADYAGTGCSFDPTSNEYDVSSPWKELNPRQEGRNKFTVNLNNGTMLFRSSVRSISEDDPSKDLVSISCRFRDLRKPVSAKQRDAANLMAGLSSSVEECVPAAAGPSAVVPSELGVLSSSLEDHPMPQNAKRGEPSSDSESSRSKRQRQPEPILPQTSPDRRVEESEFQKFRNQILNHLPQVVEEAKKNKKHKREIVYETPDEYKVDQNFPVKIDNAPPGIEKYAKGATHYTYYTDPTYGHIWSGGWHAIQTNLSTHQKPKALDELFHVFGSPENLKTIYKDFSKGKDLPAGVENYAPYGIEEGWADPWIGQMALHFFGVKSDLIAVNQVPEELPTPPELFKNGSEKDPVSFSKFKQKLIDHFNGTQPAPVMIDNGIYDFNILGIGHDGPNLILWIADPAIKGGRNKANTDIKDAAGLYTVTLNPEGKVIEKSLKPFQSQKLALRESSRSIDFSNHQGWAALFPQ